MNPTWLYVAVVYAAAVWLARRLSVDLPWRFAAFFYALVLLFLFRPLTGPYVGLPVDYYQLLPPWSRITHGRHLGNFDLNDLAMQMVPWAHQVRESWKTLHVPLWNARAGCGYPLLANGQSAALSPLRMLALPLSLGHSMTAEAAMKLLIALTFTFLYCRRRGYGEIASAVASVGFGFGTFMTVWLNFPHVTTACFLPATLYALELLVERISYRRAVFAALLWAAILFSGHPETAAHIFSFVLLNLVWIVAVERPFSARAAVRFLLSLGAIMVVAALIAAPFLAPFAEALHKSSRYVELRSGGGSPVGFTDFGSAIVLFQPRFFGDIPAEISWGPEHAESITGFAGVLGVAAFVALLLRTLILRRFRSRELFYVFATIIVVGVVLDWPVFAPVFNKIFVLAANARLRLLLGFLFAIQAAALVDLLETGAPRFAADRLPILAGLATVALMLLWLMQPSRFGMDWMQASATLAILPSAIVIGVAALAVLPGRSRFPLLLLLVIAVVVEIWHSGIEWNRVVPEREMYPQTPLIRKLEAIRASTPPNDPFRVVGLGAMFFPNANAIYGIDDIRVHDPMANAAYVDVLRNSGDYRPGYFAQWFDLASPALNLLNVRYVLAEPEVPVEDRQRYLPVYQGKDGSIFENRDVLPRFFAPPNVVLEFDRALFATRLRGIKDWSKTAVLGYLPVENDRERQDLLAPRPHGAKEPTVTIVEARDTSYRLRVVAPRYSLVTGSVAWWPGWHVTANGRAVEPLRVNGAFLGFVVRPGVNDVDIEFAPPSFRLGALASLLTLAALAALSRRSLRLRLTRAAESE